MYLRVLLKVYDFFYTAHYTQVCLSRHKVEFP